MIKLRKVISDLAEDFYKSIEENLIKNKADNFLFLFQSYRSKTISDDGIIKTLNINSNSFYVLKSRLYDKIQEFMSGDIHSNVEEVIKQLHLIPQVCYTSSREIAAAFLQKLEKDLLRHDMHNELLVVYSALKKIHLYSEKYFFYSQLYNKHIAFSLSIEKSEEILGNFNLALGQYFFSRSTKSHETLNFLKKGISEHYALNPSKQIEIIKNLIELKLYFFCGEPINKDYSVEEMLMQTQKILQNLPESSPSRSWLPVLDYLFFEYYVSINQTKQAQIYYEKVNALRDTLLLYNNIAFTPNFLITKIVYLQQQDRISELQGDYGNNFLYDPEDRHSQVMLGIYNAMISFYAGKPKEAASRLNEILNINSFKDFFHINTDIKLSLAYFYLCLKEYDLADSILKNISRKIKSDGLEKYTNVIDLIKVFNEDIKQGENKITAKQKDYFTLFLARNNGENKIISPLVYELKKKYT